MFPQLKMFLYVSKVKQKFVPTVPQFNYTFRETGYVS